MANRYLDQVIDHAQSHRGFRETLSGIARQSACAAAGAGAGGLIGGPLGALVGTMIGGVCGYIKSTDYSNVFEIIRDLSDEQKEDLTSAIWGLVGSAALPDFIEWFKSSSNQKMFMQAICTAAAVSQSLALN